MEIRRKKLNDYLGETNFRDVDILLHNDPHYTAMDMKMFYAHPFLVGMAITENEFFKSLCAQKNTKDELNVTMYQQWLKETQREKELKNRVISFMNAEISLEELLTFCDATRNAYLNERKNIDE